MVQWLGLYSSTACSTGLIPGWGTKILYAVGAECPPPPRKEVIYIYIYKNSHAQKDKKIAVDLVIREGKQNLNVVF